MNGGVSTDVNMTLRGLISARSLHTIKWLVILILLHLLGV